MELEHQLSHRVSCRDVQLEVLGEVLRVTLVILGLSLAQSRKAVAQPGANKQDAFRGAAQVPSLTARPQGKKSHTMETTWYCATPD